jgi:hypothetical protein
MRIIPSVRFLLPALVVLAMSASAYSQIGVGVAITIGPPAIPVYEQPICPGDGYLWTPGYWAYDSDIGDYYWVPGTWVVAPEVGFLWTPGWWGWGDGGFFWHVGYWGPHIGFYGGINYGFGYFGAGFEGGYWESGHFFYNREVTNVNVTVIHNVYSKTVINNTTVNRVSYNGGEGGITARSTPEEEAAGHERHIAPVATQTQHEQAARSNPQQRASVNHGKPAVAATAKPGDLHGREAVPAKEAGAPYHPPANRGGTEQRGNQPAGRAENNVPRPGNAVHPNDLPARERATPPNTGNPKLDKRYQQEQEKLNAQQDKERQKLQQQQEKEHQQTARQKPNETGNQQLEQKHQQQTQQLQQKHAQQQQQLQERQQRSGGTRPPK